MARGNADKNIRFLIAGDVTGLQRGLKQAATELSTFESRITQFSRSFDKVGKAVQRHLVLPMAAVGVASIKVAADFEASMQKIVALVGLPQAQVESFKEGVKDLAVETGRSAKELADALFFITSAGIRGGESGDPMEVLAMSAKAAAAGMGETKIVADALTSAVNAYGVESLSAAEATDVLVATIREGKLEADQVSQVIGKVIPIAAELGVEFREVGAAIATMSRIGIDADVGSTALRAALSVLLKPTAEARDALASIGETTESLRDRLANDGLLPMLTFLAEKFDGNTEAIGKVFGNVRSLTGVLAILADNAKQADIIFGSMADNTGDTDRAFAAVADTVAFKLSKAFSALKVAGIELGEELAPIVSAVAEKVTDLADAFSKLDDSTQDKIGGFFVWTLAAGAAVVVFSKLTAGIVAVVAGLAKLKELWVFARVIALEAAGVGGAVFGGLAGWAAGGIALAGAGYGGEVNLSDMTDAEVRAYFAGLGITPEDMGYEVGGGGTGRTGRGGLGSGRDRSGRRGPAQVGPDPLLAWASAYREVAGDGAWANNVMRETVTAFSGVNTAISDATETIKLYYLAVAASTDPLLAAVSAWQAYETALEASTVGGETNEEMLDRLVTKMALVGSFAELGDPMTAMEAFALATQEPIDKVVELFEHLGLLDGMSVYFDVFGNFRTANLGDLLGAALGGDTTSDGGRGRYDRLIAGQNAAKIGDREGSAGQTVNVETINMSIDVENDPGAARAIIEELADKIKRLDREGAIN